MQISVITPCFNAAEFIANTIESVAVQRHIALEHILVDDGSTDATSDLLQRYQARYSHIKVIRLPQNGGQARARNAGLDAARGEYVAFLDSDDYYPTETTLSTWYAAAKTNEADLVRANYYRLIEATGKIIEVKGRLSSRNERGLDIEKAPELVNNTSCWLMLYRRAFLEEGGIRFSPLLRQREDRPFFLLAMLRARTINLISESLVVYRVRAGSTMSTVTWDQFDLFATHLGIVSEYMWEFAPGDQRKAFRRANLLYYIHNLVTYWAPLIKERDALDRPELCRLIEVGRKLDWNTGLLLEDRLLEHVSEERRDSYFYDFVLVLLKLGLAPAFRSLLLNHRYSIREAIAVARDVLNVKGKHEPLHREILLQFFRQHAPKVAAAPALPVEIRANRAGAAGLPRILLHAGMTKTGSSSLQTFFEINRSALYERYGVYYPFTGLESGRGPRAWRTSGHARLIARILKEGPRALEELSGEIAELPTPPRIVVLSSENIVSERFWNKGDTVRAIANAFQGADLRVVIYFRRQEDWLESAYVESVTSPGLRYRGAPLEFAADQRRAGLLDFTSIDSAWRSHIPKERLIYRSYEQARAKGDIVDDFLPLVGVEDGAPEMIRPTGPARNESVPKLAAYFIRKLNHVKLDQLSAAALNAQIINLVQKVFPANAGEEGYAFYSEEDRAAIASLYDLGNRAFYSEYIGAMPAYTSKPQLKRVNDVALIPASLLDAFFELYVEAFAKANISARKKVPHRVISPLFDAYASRALTRLRAAMSSGFRRALHKARVIGQSGFFDEQFYLEQEPAAAHYPGGPLMHYVRLGAQMGLDPSKQFSTKAYLERNSDVAAAGENALYHYVAYGKSEGRSLK